MRWICSQRQRLFERMLAARSYLFSMSVFAPAVTQAALELLRFGEAVKFKLTNFAPGMHL